MLYTVMKAVLFTMTWMNEWMNEWMKYLLFHERNLQFALILNTIYGTKLNCKRIWNETIANG